VAVSKVFVKRAGSQTLYLVRRSCI
jgi:hypothetical protein